MYYLCLIATIVLGAAAVGVLVAGIRMSLEDRSIVPAALFGLMACLVGFLAILPMALYAESQQPTFELVKRDWRCTASHEDATVIMQKVGDVTVPQTITQEVCDRYERSR